MSSPYSLSSGDEVDVTELFESVQPESVRPFDIYLPGDFAYGFWADDKMYYKCRIRSFQKVNQAYDVVFVEDGKHRLLEKEKVVDEAEANRR